MRQLEGYEPTGDDDIDTEWRTALQRRFAQIAAERRSANGRLTELDSEDHDRGNGNPALLDLLPQGVIGALTEKIHTLKDHQACTSGGNDGTESAVVSAVKHVPMLWVPPAGFEPALSPPEGDALSPELRGLSEDEPSRQRGALANRLVSLRTGAS